MLFKTFPRCVQPGPMAMVDWSNPLTYGMAFCYLPGIRSDNLDLIKNRAPTSNGTPTLLSAGPGGKTYLHSLYNFAYPRDTLLENSAVTFAYFGRGISGTNLVPMAKAYQNGSGTVKFTYGMTWSTTTAYNVSFTANGTTVTSIANTKTVDSTRPHVVMGTVNGTAAVSYWNGVLDNSTTLAANLVYDATSTGNLVIAGQAGNATTNGWTGDIYLACVWNRALTAMEAKRFADNPWQIFIATPEKNFPVTSAILSGYQGDTIRTIDRIGAKTEVVKLDIGGSTTESIIGPATKLTGIATGLPIQHLKDAGRTAVVYATAASGGSEPVGIQPLVSSAPAAQPAAPTTGFAVNNLVAVRGTTVSTGSTAKTITSGKTLRIESISLMYLPTTTVGYMRVDLLWDPNSTPSTTSPIVASWTIGTPSNGASNNTAPMEIHFPDGLELTGGAIGLSTVELQAANSTSANAATYYSTATGSWAVTVTINGYEY